MRKLFIFCLLFSVATAHAGVMDRKSDKNDAAIAAPQAPVELQGEVTLIAPVIAPAPVKETEASIAASPKAAQASAVATTLTAKQAKKLTKIKNKLEKRAAKMEKAGTSGSGRQILAIVCAFFLGGLAIHRVVMGGTPLLILFYLLTFGGIFGIVPLIDFFALMFVPEKYLDSNRFFAFA